MSLTTQQKADVGLRFSELLTKQIEASMEKRDKIHENNPTAAKHLDVFAQTFVKELFGKHPKIESVSLGNDDYLSISFGSGERPTRLSLYADDFPTLKAAREETKRQFDEENKLRNEESQLVGLLNRVTEFQDYAERMWAPSSKDEVITNEFLATLISHFSHARIRGSGLTAHSRSR